ncbi:hypothetical protein A1O7_07926 [Cladophialophora yegresii CBS 114405]|uniref:DUF6604 domain-containing protein n=1 Tax=Cladophialophora yegresii CBS 114405 TaxID=1182544 RepID=W9VPV7_9EURO|nr:uncharacterized protein A1O7_07926 [Cladophialophora yegresii CBS 114405]EXJ57578.1 hypothetical protein A1O7_07926 [Cladophialophora yegresii CBS 114405]
MALGDCETVRLQASFRCGSRKSLPQNQALKIPLKHIPDMAQSIVENGEPARIQSPASIVTIPKRAVATRKLFSEEMQQGLLSGNKASHSSHSYFVKELEKSLETLIANSPSQSPSTTSEGSTTGTVIATAPNRFDCLQVEDVEEDDNSEAMVHAPGNHTKEEAEQTFEVIDESEQQLERLVILHDYLKEL